jgi:DNA-binding PadR family transcriptional regulator
VSEVLDRVRREIRERLESTRAAVFEYERLEAALHALGDAGLRATRAVRGGGRGSRAPETGRRSGAAAKRSSASRARTGKQASVRSGTTKRPGAGAATPRSERAKKRTPPRARAATSARKRAPRGANREAVVRVVAERPGVTARELAAASQVTGGTLYTLLRRLTDDGTLEKRALPGGQAGYALATDAGVATRPAAAQPPAATTEAGPGEEARASERPERQRDSTPTADAADSEPNETQSS